jgi:hypothetical protein
MKVLIFEDNLIWSSRLVKSLTALGHEAVVAKEPADADAAVLNLASPALKDLVPQLREMGIYVIGHAGHKEKDLHQLGKEAGCDKLATNGELTYKIEAILDQVKMPGQQQ